MFTNQILIYTYACVYMCLYFYISLIDQVDEQVNADHLKNSIFEAKHWKYKAGRKAGSPEAVESHSESDSDRREKIISKGNI